MGITFPAVIDAHNAFWFARPAPPEFAWPLGCPAGVTVAEYEREQLHYEWLAGA